MTGGNFPRGLHLNLSQLNDKQVCMKGYIFYWLIFKDEGFIISLQLEMSTLGLAISTAYILYIVQISDNILLTHKGLPRMFFFWGGGRELKKTSTGEFKNICCITKKSCFNGAYPTKKNYFCEMSHFNNQQLPELFCPS